MSELGILQAELAAEGARLSRDAVPADNTTAREEADRRHRKLAAEQDRVSRQMAELGDQMQRRGEAIERVHAPLEAMGREMERAAQPMEALGVQMEALGEEMERISEQADRTTRAAIDQAARDGKLIPIQGQAAR
jgi:hypothetical protein